MKNVTSCLVVFLVALYISTEYCTSKLIHLMILPTTVMERGDYQNILKFLLFLPDK